MPGSRSLSLQIAGFPTTELELEFAGLAVRLYGVARLEELVDRERMLREQEISDPPYWAHLWVGARALARHLAADGDLAGCRVLDLGCGLGLTGLVAAARGAEVWFADKEPVALEFARASAARNGFDAVHFATLDFTRESLDVGFDAILGAEVVYDPAAYSPLAAFVERHLHPGGIFWVTDAFRSDAIRFFDDLRARGFAGERRRMREWDEARWQGVFLWSFRR